MERGVRVLLAPAGGTAGAVSLRLAPGENLARAIWLSGAVAPRPLCLGLGRCGRCRVRYVRDAPPALPADEAVLGPDEVAGGWRLACRRSVPPASEAESGLELELPPLDFAPVRSAGPSAPFGTPQEADGEVVLGVDLGTTSIQWRAVAVRGSGAQAVPAHILGEGSDLN
ncbi:MAG: FeS-binding protein, partial [Desulfovibrio sp.]|nr:FeS-binding protein [Desulfovibrio sp.]